MSQPGRAGAMGSGAPQGLRRRGRAKPAGAYWYDQAGAGQTEHAPRERNARRVRIEYAGGASGGRSDNSFEDRREYGLG